MDRHPWSAVMAWMIVAASIVTAAHADDPDLVLHYRFDEDRGERVEDHSSHGNDGVNKFGQYLDEVRGRHGVMRFDGEKAIVSATGESLQLKGDYTYAFWVRLNGIEKSSDCVIFGTPQHFFSLSSYINLVFVAYGQSKAGDSQTMFWPVDRDMVGTDWSHIAIVMEYPRIRFYRNGQLIEDNWVPFSMDSPIEDGKTIHFGSNGRQYGFIDLDEVAVFNRALSASQIEAIANGADPAALSTLPQHEIQMEPYWYDGILTMRLSAYHQGALAEGVAHVTLETLDGETRTVEATCTPSRAMGHARATASADFALDGLDGKALRVTFDIRDDDGQSLASFSDDFLLDKPAWVHNSAGIPDQAPPPWTQVEVQAAQGGHDIDIWGRRYHVGATPLFAQVESKDAAMLAEPMRLVATSKPLGSGIADADTMPAPVQWVHQQTEWEQQGGLAATFTQHFTSGELDLAVKGATEFDGFTRFDVTVTARSAAELSQLVLEIPVVPEHAPYAYAHEVNPPRTIKVGDTTRTDYTQMNQSGRLEGDLAFPFTCEVSLGDDERMLVWQAESPAGWRNESADHAIDITKTTFAHTIRIRFIDAVTVLNAGESRTFTFALLATPAKPMERSVWDLRIARSEPMVYDFDWPDREYEGKPALQHVADMGYGAVLTIGGYMWPYPLPLGNEWFAQQIKRNIQAFHEHGIRNYSYMIHQRFPMRAPEFEFHAAHMAVSPFRTFGVPSAPRHTPRTHTTILYGTESNGAFDVCPASLALRDANAYALDQRLRYFGDDGVYLDGTSSYHWLCKNTKHGCGYIDENGDLQPTRPIFGVREYIKRLYLVAKSFDRDNIVDIHDSFGLNTSGLAYGDFMTTGERWHHLNTTEGGVPYVADAVSLDVARHEFTGRQHNIALAMASHRLGDYIRISATTLLLDVPVFPSVDGSEAIIDTIDQAGETHHHKYSGDAQVFSLICRARDRFGVDEAKRILYYEGVERFAVVHNDTEQCHTTLYIHPTNGVLAFVTNRAPDRQSMTIDFDLDALGLDSQTLQVQDMMYGRSLAIGDDGVVTLELDSERWTYLWLQPAP